MRKCPPWCHRCPRMNGPDGQRMVMPMCWGMVIGNDPYDLSRCYCNRPKLRAEQKKDRQIASLKRRVRELEAKLELLINSGGGG